MPLFKSTPPPPPPPVESSPPTRSRSIFSRGTRSDRSPSPTYDNHYNNNGNRTGGFFSRRRSSSSDEYDSGRYSGGSTNGDLRNDPSIRAARQKVSDAEAYEREADRALNAARGAVREAREHVRMLEREALEDARRAKAKQAEAKTVSKSARGLGRHG